MTAPTPTLWHPTNCTVLYYDSDSSSQTWIPIIWVSHSPHLEHLRIQEIQCEYRNTFVNYTHNTRCTKQKNLCTIYRCIKNVLNLSRTPQ